MPINATITLQLVAIGHRALHLYLPLPTALAAQARIRPP